jgi:lysozyme family protein
MADFSRAYARTMAHEGGYANDTDDAGGETYRGISRRFNPAWTGWARIDAARKARDFPKNLEADTVLQREVAAFHRSRHWDRLQGDAIPDQDVANELFDTGVNLGVVRAVEFLQRALNVLNRNARLYPDLAVDGVLGPKTQAALETCLRQDGPDLILKIMNVLQGAHYLEFMNRDPVQEKFARGWFKRVEINLS